MNDWLAGVLYVFFVVILPRIIAFVFFETGGVMAREHALLHVHLYHATPADGG